MPRKTHGPLRAGRLHRQGFNEAAARCRGKRAADGNAFVTRLSFNEAAARCRGKPPTASLRAACISSRFNEAAARCRGKRREGRIQVPARRGFNEAAARCRGKLTLLKQLGLEPVKLQ